MFGGAVRYTVSGWIVCRPLGAFKMLNQMTRVAIVASMFAAGSAMGEPEVFSQNGFEADQRAAADAGKLQVAYFTATWCPPCKKMKAETWVDEEVVSWADANAIITPVDVDKYGSLAQKFHARSIPTIVVIVGDKEVARTVGYQSASNFTDWLEGVRDEHAGDLRPMSTTDSSEDTAAVETEELRAGDVLRSYNVEVKKDQSGLGMTGSVLLPQLAKLSKTDPILLETLTERVGELSTLIESGSINATGVREYLQLAPLTEYAEEATAWVEAQLAIPAGKSMLSKHKMLVQNILTDAGSYELASEFIGNPVQQARKLVSASARSTVTLARNLKGNALSAFKTGNTDLLNRGLADLVAMAQISGDDAKANIIANMFGQDAEAAQEAINAAAERAGVEAITIE
jgi:thiol-disulfide isomerase/thioredoxin